MNDRETITAISSFLPRTGARELQIRYSDEEQPTIWMAVALYPEHRFETAAGPTPLIALTRLAETLVDGGHCTHCNRPTGFTIDQDVQLLDHLVCWYQLDHETKAIRRGCE